MPSAVAGGAQVEPPVRSFTLLEDARSFLAPGRALGFFSAVDTPEHTVFLTVAKQIGDRDQQPGLMVELGRATVGRGTSGATVYLVPRATAAAPNGTAIPGLLIHQYRVPASPQDSQAVQARWEALQLVMDVTPPPPSPPTPQPSPPPPSMMWEEILESEALALHRFLRAGGLPDVIELTASSLQPLTDAAWQLGVLLLPPALSASMRGYHVRRLGRVASTFSPWRCDGSAREAVEPWEKGPDGELEPSEDRHMPWDWVGRTACEAVPPGHAARFAYATSSLELAALLGARLGVLPVDLPFDRVSSQHARFALLLRHRASSWRVHALNGPPDGARITTLVRRHLELASGKMASGFTGTGRPSSNAQLAGPAKIRARHDEL